MWRPIKQQQISPAMLSFFKLSLLAIVASTLLVHSTDALSFTLTSYSCSVFNYEVEVTSAEWDAAYFATLYINDVNNEDIYAQAFSNVSQSSGILQSGVDYSFTASPEISSSLAQAQGWVIGIALNYANGTAFETTDDSQNHIANKCLSPSQQSSTSTTITTPSPIPTNSSPISSPTPSTNPNPSPKSKLPAIVGGIVGAIALLAAVALLLFMRNRKAARRAQDQQQYNNYSRDASGGSAEKGFVSSAPIDSINQLPQQGSYGGADYIEKGSGSDRASSVPTFTSPPISPRQSTWYGAGMSPASPPPPAMSMPTMSPPMSPTMSATSGAAARSSNPLFSAPSAAAPMPAPSSGPARSNNPLVNFDMGNWSASPNVGSNTGASPAANDLPQPQSTQSSTLPEPMSRH